MKTLSLSLLASLLVTACGVEQAADLTPTATAAHADALTVARATTAAAVPTVQQVTAGTAWRRVAVTGTFADADTGGTTTAVAQSLVVIESADGIATSPLPDLVKQELTAEAQQLISLGEPADLVWVVDETSASDFVKVSASGTSNKASCPDYDKTYSTGWTPNVTRSYGLDNIASELRNSGSLSVTVGAGLTGELKLRVKRFDAVLGCVPYAVGFRKVSLTGSANVEGRVQLQGTVGGTSGVVLHRQTELEKLDLGSVAFSIGPVPVVFGLNLPLEAGLDFTGGYTADVDFTVRANASYTVGCTSSSCSTQMTASRSVRNNGSGNVPLSLRANLSPWVRASLRGYLYSDSLAYAQVGVKGTLVGDLWAYHGSQCGDGDGDGIAEQVNALTLDVGMGVDISARASVVGHTVWEQSWPVVPVTHLAFWDLLSGGSTAAQPIFFQVPNATSTRSLALATPTLTMKAQMRPCWPYADAVTYQLAWGDAQSTVVSASPQTAWTRAHTYTYGGTRPVRLTATTDAAGRPLNLGTTRTITVLGILPPIATP